VARLRRLPGAHRPRDSGRGARALVSLVWGAALAGAPVPTRPRAQG
jgi:hypothetical protein